MPCFHFNVHDGRDIPDPSGTELRDLPAARLEALRYSGELLGLLGADFWNGQDWRMDVTDHDGLLLFTLSFAATDAPVLMKAGQNS